MLTDLELVLFYSFSVALFSRNNDALRFRSVSTIVCGFLLPKELHRSTKLPQNNTVIAPANKGSNDDDDDDNNDNNNNNNNNNNKVTNSVAYGTRRFNAAFTRPLQ